MVTRRDNGQPAAPAYAPLVDVDPPLADHVLTLLGDTGIAAYAEPVAGETGPYRDVRPPDRPTTRVFVDRAELSRARDVVGRTLPALRADFLADAAARADHHAVEQAQVDAQWAQIVAGFDAPPTADPVPRWSVLEDVDPDRPDDPDPGTARGPGSGLSSRLVRRAVPPPTPEDDPVVAEPAQQVHDDPSDHYQPPHPPPMPRPRDAVARFAWAGALGGPLLVIVANVAGLERWVAGLGVVAFVVGFATLVARMKERHDDGWDDGAVV